MINHLAVLLRVNPGDRVALETWVRYRNETDYTNGVKENVENKG